MSLRRLASGAAVLLVTLLLAEGALRLTWFRGETQRSVLSSPRYRAFLAAGMLESVPREERRYRLHPGAAATVEGIRYAVNPLGFRGPDFPVTAPSGVARILFLGDSFAFGWDVDFADSIGARLEDHLAGAAPGDPSIRVLNAGVPGYTSGQEADLLLHEGRDLAPDGVLLLYYPNDMIEEAFLYDDARRVLYADALPLPFAWRTRLRPIALYALPSRLWTRHLYRSGQLSAGTPKGWAASRRALLAMREACREDAIPFFVTALPLLTDTRNLARDDHASAEQMGWLEAFVKEEEIPYLSLLEVLREEPVELSLSPDLHLNPRGCERVAARLATELSSRGWIDDLRDAAGESEG